MNITYIHHSSFSVELESVVLIFDYYKGTIPEFDKNKQIFVFASHVHYDHFNNEIFGLSELYPQITYILSKDITTSNEICKDKIIYTPANTTVDLPYSSGSKSIICETFKSTDEGVGFLINVEGKVIYHAGDLHWWAWEEYTHEEALSMENNFKREIAYLQGRQIDVAFLPLDGRLGHNYWLGFDYFMKHTDTKVAFPMHFWKDYSIIGKFKKTEETIAYENKIMTITEDNQRFII